MWSAEDTDRNGAAHAPRLQTHSAPPGTGEHVHPESLAAIVESSSDAVIAGTVDGTITSWNPAAEVIYGYPAQEVIGKSIALIIPDDHREELADILRRVAAGERINRYETVRVRKDGRRIEVSVCVLPGKNEAGNVTGAIVVAHDVTGHRRDERIHRLLAMAGDVLGSSLDYEVALNNVLQIMVPYVADWGVVDVVGDDGIIRCVAVAQRDPEKEALTRELLRFPPDLHWHSGVPQVIRTRRSTFIPELQDTDLVGAAHDQYHLEILRALRPRSFICTPLTSRGRVLGAISLLRSVNGSPFTSEDLVVAEELARRAGVAVDNARLFRNVEEQRRRLQIVLEQIPEGVVIVEATDSRLSLWNRAARRSLPLLGPNLQEQWRITQPRRTDGTAYAFEDLPLVRALHGETVLGIEVLFIRDDGSRQVLLVNAAPIVDQMGMITAAVVVFQDITQRKSMEQQREEFLSIAAHELKTPLTTVRGNSQFLLRGVAQGRVALGDRDIEMLSLIDRKAGHLSRLVDELLELSRIQSGRLALHPTASSLPALIRRVVLQIQPIYVQHPITVVDEPQTGDGIWDEDRLEQVLTNLIDNAAKYSATGSPIAVGSSIWLEPNQLHIWVHDAGIGIPPQDLPHLFEPHYRGSNVGPGRSGLGLGLYLCREIIEHHGGRIWAESEIGQGTTVHIVLPRYPDSQ